MPHRLNLLPALLCLVACQGWSPQWEGARQGQDPDPKGPPHLRAYKEEHYLALGRNIIEGIDHAELRRRIEPCRVLLLGDRHDHRVLHQQQVQLLTALQSVEIRLVLGLEAIGRQDEDAVAAYLAGSIEFEQLRRRIAARWPGSWLEQSDFDQTFYRTLLNFARTWGIPVFALEDTPRPVLAQRDAKIAARIEEQAQAHADHLVVAVVGHTHLAGPSRLIENVSLPKITISAQLSRRLHRSLITGYQRIGPVLVSDRDVYFFNNSSSDRADAGQDLSSQHPLDP